jgi:hypothetical protein
VHSEDIYKKMRLESFALRGCYIAKISFAMWRKCGIVHKLCLVTTSNVQWRGNTATVNKIFCRSCVWLLVWRLAIPVKFLWFSSVPPSKILGQYLTMDHDCLLPCPFQFIQPSDYMTCRVEKVSLNKLGKNIIVAAFSTWSWDNNQRF